MKRTVIFTKRYFLKTVLLTLFYLLLFSSLGLAKGKVIVLEIDGVINPVASRYIVRNIEIAEKERAEAVVLELSTPGGLLNATRDILKKFLASEVAIIVYIYPPGSHAASAGTFITLGGHISAMAPATNMGSAHPVAGQGKMSKAMEKKVVNDTVALIKNVARQRGKNIKWAEKAVRESVAITPQEAVNKKVIDFIAKDLDDLLTKADGRVVKLPSGKKKLHLKGAEVVRRPMNWADDILNMIAHPNVAYILMTLGIYAWIYEFSAPGIGLGAVFGTISLFLAFFALQVLPVNWTALFLIIAGISFLILELKMHSGGILSLGGIASFVIGSFMLFDASTSPYYKISPPLVFLVTGVTAAFVFLALRAVLNVMKKKSIVGVEVLQGNSGFAEKDFAEGEGIVMVEGELWKAKSEAVIKKGDKIQVISKDGIFLQVKKIV